MRALQLRARPLREQRGTPGLAAGVKRSRSHSGGQPGSRGAAEGRHSGPAGNALGNPRAAASGGRKLRGRCLDRRERRSRCRGSVGLDTWETAAGSGAPQRWLGLLGRLGHHARLGKNSASTRRSSGRRSIRSAGIAAAVSSTPPDIEGFVGARVDSTRPDARPAGLASGSAAAGESTAGTTRSALHRGHATIEPALPGAEARSWLH